MREVDERGGVDVDVVEPGVQLLLDQLLDRGELVTGIGGVFLGVDLYVVALDEQRPGESLAQGGRGHDRDVLRRALIGVGDLAARDFANHRADVEAPGGAEDRASRIVGHDPHIDRRRRERRHLAAPAGHAECLLPRAPDNLARIQLAWEETRTGSELTALRLVFDPQLAPPLTDLEWQLTRGWGPPLLEQLRREHDQKFFTLQWEDADHRATLEAQAPRDQPSRAMAVVFERKQVPLSGEFASLHPRPFPNFRVRWIRRIDWEGQMHAVLWGTSLTPAQEAMGEQSATWVTQRNYVGIWKLEPASGTRPRRWKPLWERITGGDDDEQPQRVLYVDARDVTGDGVQDVIVELSCETCGATADELIVKTIRAGKLVDLLAKRDLYRARVELGTGQLRIREPEGEDDQGLTVSTYAYDRGKGAFVLAREERTAAPGR